MVCCCALYCYETEKKPKKKKKKIPWRFACIILFFPPNGYNTLTFFTNFLLLDGKPAHDRRWMEVYGKLTGTVLSVWDAASLNSPGYEPSPTYLNITDASFKFIYLLPSPNGDLSNIIVLSTTLKNRYLIQVASPTLLHEWFAGLRLSHFENSALQEAYTGALLSSKGSKLNGIRTLLTETRFRHEDYVSVRFGSGMPWNRCWAVVSPSLVKKKKHLPPPCTIAFYEDKKSVKGPPLALVTGSYATYAVYPQNSLLINNSTMIKIEGKVSFNDVSGEKDASIFLMPEAHAGVPGFETLIRFLIPVLDTFQLYGRPQRLNADKADMRSLLFGLPTLPYTQYLELNDVEMLVALQGAENWSSYDWVRHIKDLLARKMSTGYKGTGRIRPSSMRHSRFQDRSVSQPISFDNRPYPAGLRSVNENVEAASIDIKTIYQPQPVREPAVYKQTPVSDQQETYMQRDGQNYDAQQFEQSRNNQIDNQQGYAKSNSDQYESGQQGQQIYEQDYPQQPQQQQQQQAYSNETVSASSLSTSEYNDARSSRAAHLSMPPPVRAAPVAPVRMHERSASSGSRPNNLLSVVHSQTQPISPLLPSTEEFPEQQQLSHDEHHRVHRRPVSSVPAEEDGQAYRYDSSEQSAHEHANPYQATGRF
jgi:CCR4-NOT transcriptional complex subunit CAF120